MSDIIAVVDDEKCNPDKCNKECVNFDPLNRSPTGPDGFHIDEETGKARISESVVMEGHRISADKCPFDAIQLVNLKHETGEKLHQYGENQFRLYGLPAPREDEVVGVLGRNGTGKSTALSILSGELKPNLGEYNGDIDWGKIVESHRGTDLQTYFESLADSDIDASIKLQRVDNIPERFKGSVSDLLDKLDDRGVSDSILDDLGLSGISDRSLSDLSGGELQRVALTGCLSKDADIYLIDEPSSFLDVKQRLNAARVIRRETEGASTVTVEHDLATLDMIADLVHVVHGEPGAYGMVSNAMSSRVGINQYMEGYLKSHNLRIRDESITFLRGGGEKQGGDVFVEYSDLEKSFGSDFELFIDSGEIYEGEVLGIMGQNALGKTTFAKMLVGEVEPDSGKLSSEITVSYKPQQLSPPGGVVRFVFAQNNVEPESSSFRNRVGRPLELEELYDRDSDELSGGELQRVGIGLALGRDADLYLLDEPSAYLDVETRVSLARLIGKFARNTEKPVIVIDHDLVFLDYISDRVMVFEGESGKEGYGKNPVGVQDGFDDFLRSVDITFRRDPDTGRPRSNKPGSQKDRTQRNEGVFYE